MTTIKSQGEDKTLIIGHPRTIELTRQQARDLLDVPIHWPNALMEALDEAQGEADEQDAVIILVVKAGEI